MNNRAIQPDAHRAACFIEFAVIRSCGDNVFHGRTGNGFRYQRSDQQPCNRGIAVREMKNVWLFLAAFRQSQSLKTGIGERTVVVSRLVASQGADRFDADAKEVVCKRLEEWQRFRNQLAVFRQVFRVADFVQQRGFFFHGHSRQIIFLFRVNARDTFSHRIGERRSGKEFRPRRGIHAGDQAVFAECFFIEEGRRPHLRIEFLIVGLIKPFGPYPDFGDQCFCNVAVLSGTFDGLRPAVAQHHASAGAKFIALGVAAKIIVIVEDQNPRALPGALAEKIGGCQSANASANDRKIVFLARAHSIPEGIRAFAVPQAMRKRECSVVITAYSRARGRIIIRRLFRSKLIEGSCGKHGLRGHASTDQRSANANGHAIQKIPARYFPAHPQIFVCFLLAHRGPLSRCCSRRL